MEKEEERKNNKMDVFEIGLLDRRKHLTNIEGSKAKPNCLNNQLDSTVQLFEVHVPIPYVWDTILKQHHPYDTCIYTITL